MADNYSGYTIKVVEMTGNLMAGDCTGLDTVESPRRYCELLRERLVTEFPGAEINVHLERAQGVCPETKVYSPDGDMDAEESAVLAIGSIEESLFSSAEWYVETSN